MPATVGDHSANSSLSIPRSSTDGGASHGTVTPTTAQSVSGISWSTSDSTLAPEGKGRLSSFDVQLQMLTDQLKVENRIKEGAENLLQMPLNDALRSQVESELATAMKKIQAIQKSMESLTGRGVRKRSNETNGSGKRKFTGQPLQATAGWKEEGTERDDFRSAMHQANSAIKNLVHLSRHHSHSHANSAVPSPSTSPSTSTLPNPATATEAELNRARVDTMAKLITILQRNLRVRYELDVGEVVHAVLPSLADKATKQARATAYRLIRHSLVDTHSVRRLGEQHLDWYIVKSLSRDNKHTVEKEQVIKLIRSVVDIGSERHSPHSAIGSGTVPLSDAVMRALIAVAEYPEDPFKPICVQTLTEILLIDIELMARNGGIRVLLHALAEGPSEMAPLLAAAFLHIVDSPKTRVYLNPGTDFELAFSGITDAYGKGFEHKEKVQSCCRIVSSMLRTWSGLMYCCINDMTAIRVVIDCLRIPSLEQRELILDMFFDLLNIKTPEWHQPFIDGRRLTMYRRPRQSADLGHHYEIPHRPQDTLKLTDQYIALLILVFSKAGLLDALTSMLEESSVGSPLSRKATLLMAEVLQKGNRVLPLSIAARIQALPRVFNLASDYHDNEHRIVGSLAMAAIDSVNRQCSRLEPTVKGDTRPRANSIEDSVRRGQRQVEQAKLKMSMQMDDKAFQALLLETQVMLTKDHMKWNFETLQDLIEGPLHNPKRMEEAIKVSRYIRKLMSFFHPFAHRFCDLPNTKPNHRWVRLGCSLLNALMASQDGIRFLQEDDFLGQLVKSFAQLDPFTPAPTPDPIFSKKRMQETLTCGYLEMLGTLSKRQEGVDLLERFKLITAFYHLTELRSREDLIKGVIENLDYSIDGHSRIVLSKSLTSVYKHVRHFSTNYLGGLIRGSQVAHAWMLRLLLTQLYDPAPEVRELAVRFLEEACESTDVLQMVVEMQPTLDHLGEVGHPLLLKFMSTPTGFRFLYAADYIDREMELWFHERNLHYVVHIEVFLAKAFSQNPSEDDEDDVLAFDGIVPPHFYGVMAKTELGCEVLQEKGHFAEFAHFIRRHGLESEDQEVIFKLKSVLWAVGNIGATERGLPFLEEEEIIPAILEIAEQSLVLSVRGTCFFVLGLISSTPQGAEILDDYHWEATLSPLGLPTGLCVPVDVDKFVSVRPQLLALIVLQMLMCIQIPHWDCVASEAGEDNRLAPPESDEEMEVMTAIYNLANTVIANSASRSLTKMRSKPEYRHIFSSPSMFYRALHTISSQKYRLPVRRYIFDLFNIELDADVVRELGECAVTLLAPPVPAAEASEPTPVAEEKPGATAAASSSFRPMPARHHVDESDEEGSDVEEQEAVARKPRAPVMSLRPKSRIIGFS
ncbi:Rapamycin-insensitive companion of mTOR, N-term-domain-containing protein [Trametes elegans]|nr:Rapamycin-insensitive companion of mTOR, N-term-domain-containing protein [Trametes elegans]